MNWKLIAFACAMSAAVALAADEISEKLSVADVQATRGQGLYRCQVHRGGGRDAGLTMGPGGLRPQGAGRSRPDGT